MGVEGIISTSVVLRVHKNPSDEKHSHTTKKDSQIAECTVVLKGGAVVHTSERSEDMYASIDLVSHKLAQKLKRHKGKVQSKRKNVKVSDPKNLQYELTNISSRSELTIAFFPFLFIGRWQCN